MGKPELSIVLPCYNESRNIPIVVDRLSKFWPETDFELVLVNNGSTDDTDRVLRIMKDKHDFVQVVNIDKNIGYGHGIMTGLKAARSDIVGYSHADIQTPPEDIVKGYRLFKKSESEKIILKGLRINRRKEEQFLTKGLESVATLLLGYSMRDINGQPKLFHKKLLDYLSDPPLDFSFDAYVMYKGIQNGFEILTFPVDFGLRIHGESKWASSRLKKYRTILGWIKSLVLISVRNLSDNNNPIKQLIKFCLVGCFGASINYGTFYLFYKLFSVHYIVSSLFGFFIAAVAIFTLNRQWTFYIKHGRISKQFVMFILLMCFSFGANGFSIYFFTDMIGFRPEISQLITMFITTTINFVGSKFWVFKK